MYTMPYITHEDLRECEPHGSSLDESLDTSDPKSMFRPDSICTPMRGTSSTDTRELHERGGEALISLGGC